MANSNKVNALAEALRIMLLEEAREADVDLSAKKMQLILSLPDDTLDMSKEKRQQIVDRLFKTASEPSLGELIRVSMKRTKFTESSLAKVTRVPATILRKLKSDSIVPNKVPVLLLRDILNRLQLSFDIAEKAVLKTFTMIQKTELDQLKASPVRAWARRPGEDKGKVLINKTEDTAGRELYENKESLIKYLSQLKHLMEDKKQ
ncbi:MAG: hypothetical protein Q8937_04250 [Bacteroidota bacterium]|nr:hypothetical protein [Bacteroidota bacterium]MDP4257421.1 hypothetical protein [Bacteroidota bacterium]